MPPLLEFIMPRPPVSQRARAVRRREWRESVQEIARQQWGTATPVSGDVAVTITYFFLDEQLDVDNIPKPILDALTALVYRDDVQVTDLVSRKRRLDDVRTRNPSRLVQESVAKSEPFTHILVEEGQSEEVVFP